MTGPMPLILLLVDMKGVRGGGGGGEGGTYVISVYRSVNSSLLRLLQDYRTTGYNVRDKGGLVGMLHTIVRKELSALWLPGV